MMTWTDKDHIRKGVLDMLRVNMGLKPGEKLLVMSDPPRLHEWIERDGAWVIRATQRSMLAKLIAEIAQEGFPECQVEFLPYASIGARATEPGDEVAQKMREAHVVIAITNQSSMSHTDARANASRAGARIATALFPEMFEPGGPMDVDYLQVSEETKKIAARLTDAKTAVVRSRAGTDITFSLEGRPGQVDDGLYRDKGRWGNLPSGEAYAVPLEETAVGQIVVEAGWARDLQTPMVLRFQGGYVVAVEGGNQVGDQLRNIVQLGRDDQPYKSRRNLAELGVGTNPNAKSVTNLVEAEKIKGTVHLAIGDNAHMGGRVTVDFHRDFVIPQAALMLDGTPILQDGKLLI